MIKLKKTRKMSNNRKRRIPFKAIGLTLFFVLLFALSVIPALFLNTPFGYLPVLVLVFLVIISYIYGKILVKHISFEELTDLKNCTRGTDEEFCIRVTNTSFLICPVATAQFYVTDIFGNIRSTTEFAFTMGPREVRDFRFGVKFDHIGEFKAGLNRMEVGNLLGLKPFVIGNNKEFAVNVTPKIHYLENVVTSDNVKIENQKANIRSGAESMDYAGVREYVMGDPIKRIHWKLSSHANGYLTKIMESYGNNGITVVLNLQSPEGYTPGEMMGIFDAIVETAVSVVDYARNRGMEAEILYYNKYGMKERYVPMLGDGYESLLDKIPPVHSEYGRYGDGISLLREEGGARYSHNNIAICTSLINDDVVRSIVDVHRNLKFPIVFYILPDNIYGDERTVALKPLKLLEAMGIPVYVIPYADAIGKVVS